MDQLGHVDGPPTLPLPPSRPRTANAPSQPSGVPIHYTYGLHSRCNSVTDTCSYFPQDSDCHGEDRNFCSLWRTVGFLMSLAVVLEGMTLIAFVVMLAGGKQKRESGWRIVCAFLCIVGVVQCAAMAFMVKPPERDGLGKRGETLMATRHSCTTTTSASSRAGNWTRAGRCARPAGACRFSLQPASQQARFCYHLKKDTN